jgi:drug/metabolite transporter (DMT)-like permease
MVLLLSLGAAIGYGLSDFIGGVVSRRTSMWAVAAVSQITATLLVAGFLATNMGRPTAGDLMWGALAGLGSGAGNVLIFNGLARGRMAVVAPLSAVVAAALPALVGLATGERPGLLAIVGVAAALPAIWLVSVSGEGSVRAERTTILNGLFAGVGFALQFSALGQVREEAGLAPLVVSQVFSVATIIVAATAWSATWLPRDRPSRLGAVSGLFAGLATISYQLAVQSGLLTIAAVVTSLYPAVTVVLATLVLKETILRAQAVGLALAGGAIALIAAG